MLNSSVSWNDLLFLNSCKTRATFLKMMALLWNVEVKALAEIGVYQGSTSRLLRALFPEATLYLIDPWEIYPAYLMDEAGPVTRESGEMEEAYLEVVRQFGSDPQTKICRQTSEAAAQDFSEKLDLVFIDGNHSYEAVKQDIQLWSSHVRIGGIISGHDYNPDKFPQVVKAVDEMFGKEVIIGDDYTWIKQKCR